MKSLLIGRTAWLLALFCGAAEFGALIPADIAGSGTPAGMMLGSLALFAVAYGLRLKSLRASYIVALAACALGAGTAAAIADRWFGGGAQACSSVFAGGVLAFCWTAVWEYLRVKSRGSRQRSTVLMLCYLTAVLTLLDGWYLNFSSVLLVWFAAGCFQFWATNLARKWRLSRGNDTTWRKSLELANRLYVTPLDVYCESLRNTSG
jgi:hypothetical protein